MNLAILFIEVIFFLRLFLIISVLSLVFYLVYEPTQDVSYDYQQISWQGLIHPEDLYARLNPPLWLGAINGTAEVIAYDVTDSDVKPCDHGPL